MHKLIVSCSFVAILTSCSFNHSKNESETPVKQSFHFEVKTTVYGNSNDVYDHLTGDISPWWDHTFSSNPHQLYIEAKPGGGFYEIFDESGDGVRHAVVTAAHRGKLLRMEGPLGLAGHALVLVSSYHLEQVGDSTNVIVKVHGSGEFNDEWPTIIEKVWEHFIIEQFTPYYHGLVQEE